jgi:hypothetical protein
VDSYSKVKKGTKQHFQKSLADNLLLSLCVIDARQLIDSSAKIVSSVFCVMLVALGVL